VHKKGHHVERATTARNEDLVELVDEAGRVIGHAARATIHHRETPRHRAFSVYLSDAAGRVLLTRRALSKLTWPGVWSNSCCGHPRPARLTWQPSSAGSARSSAWMWSTSRCCCRAFGYTAADPHGLVENEHCPVYQAAIADPTVLRPDPDEVMDYQWLSWPDLIRTVESAPDLLSPWAVAQVRALVASPEGAWLRRGTRSAHEADVTATLAG
jgi:isopentenyl-diphosphate delta-isomerase